MYSKMCENTSKRDICLSIAKMTGTSRIYLISRNLWPTSLTRIFVRSNQISIYEEIDFFGSVHSFQRAQIIYAIIRNIIFSDLRVTKFVGGLIVGRLLCFSYIILTNAIKIDSGIDVTSLHLGRV